MKKIILFMVAFLVSFNYVDASGLSCNTTLTKGIKGENVKLLQTKLNKIASCNLVVDGIYGDDTTKCVSKFQELNSLTKTGTVNKTTCKKINEVNKNSFCTDTMLKVGSKGKKVEILQEKLNEVMDCDLEVDGKYGNLTRACVMKYQMNSGLEVTGTVNGTTCSKLTIQETKIKKEKILQVTGTSLVVIEDEVKIRRGMDETSKVIKISSLGDIYQYSGVYYKKGKNWYKVKINNRYGYIESKYISKNFIVVDKSQQKLIMYKDKKVVLNTEVVTGTYGKHDTPVGYYKLEKKNLVDGKYLRGYYPDGTLEYESWVDYWMPFITKRGIGFHDADWREEYEFTDSRYLYDGSHGCINMKKEAAQKLFTNVDEDIDVIIRN